MSNINQQHIPVFFHSSNEFCPYMCVTIASILYNTKSFIEFYVVETGISDLNKKRVENLKEKFSNFSIEWITFEYNDIFKKEYLENVNTNDKPWPGIHGYCTPFLPYLNKNLKKIIYLDSDVILLDDIAKLFNENIDNFYLGVVPDIVVPLFMTPEGFNQNKNIDFCTYGKYFCAGVLLINAEKFKNDNIIEKYFELVKREIFPTCDQDVLNRLFQNDGDVKNLSQRYNVMFVPKQKQLDDKKIKIPLSMFKDAAKNPIIRHFAGSKPWKETSIAWTDEISPNQNEFWFFAKMTPFYEGISKEFFVNIICKKECIIDANDKKSYELIIILFGFITFLKIKKNQNQIKVYLLGKIHFLTIKEKYNV